MLGQLVRWLFRQSDPHRINDEEPPQQNELLSDAYNRVAKECQRKVQDIMNECKRQNSHYCDPSFDLKLDLQWELGNTLNRLKMKRFPLNEETHTSLDFLGPRAVQRVPEIFKDPTFMENVKSGDVKQGNIANCWLLGAMNALANAPECIQRLCVAYDVEIGVYGFVLYHNGEWIDSIVDDRLFLKAALWDSLHPLRKVFEDICEEEAEQRYIEAFLTGSQALFSSKNVDKHETWVPLLEKAFAKACGDYVSQENGLVSEGIENLSGGVTYATWTTDILDKELVWESLLNTEDKHFFGCFTGTGEYQNGPVKGIANGHAYVITKAKTLRTGEQLLDIQNAWGQTREGLWVGDWTDGSKKWTREAQEELDHKFGDKSTFWISYPDFCKNFACLTRTRLFLEEDWRCNQCWIRADVPQRPAFYEKFQIEVSQASPLVIVLSQLDWRYFMDLRGQYKFWLYFRLYDADHKELATTPGNLFTRRSVAVELPEMVPGTYTVCIMVKAERDPSAISAAEVIEAEKRKGGGNEKFASVHNAYILAHSKAEDYYKKIAKLTKNDQSAEVSNKLMLYSSDGMARKPHERVVWPPVRDHQNTEREIMPEAGVHCDIGLRVFNRDPCLRLWAIMEPREIQQYA